jgi:hypothetical protein
MQVRPFEISFGQLMQGYASTGATWRSALFTAKFFGYAGARGSTADT